MLKKITIIVIFVLSFGIVCAENEFIKEYLEIGEMYLKAKDYSEAINTYNVILSYDPENEEANMKMVEIYMDIKAYDAAEAFLDKLKSKKTGNKKIEKYFGDMYLSKSESEKNEEKKLEYKKMFYEAYENYLSLDGYNDSETVFFLGDMYFKDKLMEKANEVFVKDRGDSYKNYFGAATTYRFLGYYNEAINNYKKSMKRNPDFMENYLGIGITYQLSGNYINAIYNFEKYLEKIDDENVYYITAKLYMLRNELNEAKRTAEKGVKLFPDSSDLREIMIDIYAKR